MAAAQRAAEVRSAARDWRAMGWIDDAGLRAIDQRHPDDRVRQRPALRTLLWIFTVIAVQGALGLAGTVGTGETWWGVLCVLGALGCATLTEVQHGLWRLAQFGTDSATAWLALGFSIGAAAWIGDLAGVSGDGNWMLLLGAATLALAGLAAWRWGSPLHFAIAVAALFLVLVQVPLTRWTWIVAGAVALPLLDRAAASGRLAPSHRRGALVAFVVAAVALGWALHPWSQLAEARALPPALAWPGYVLFAGALLAAGLRTRRRWTLDLGIVALLVLATSTLVETGARPLWLVLTLSGTALAAAALSARRFLERERGGITSAAMGSQEGHQALEIAVTLATASPSARPAEAATDGETLRGGGGSFGGGGASSSDRTSWGLVAVLALMPLWLAGTACSRSSDGASNPDALETVEVAPPPDAAASTADDPQAAQRAPTFSGVVPADFPKDFPLEPTWSMLDFGKGYITLQVPTGLSAARAEVTERLGARGWKASGADRWRRSTREVRLTFTAAGPQTRVRVGY
jgi:hypothetical protein